MADVANARALSVVIPSYDSAAWLPSTLESLGIAIARAELEAEVIVVDDGSRDDTVEVVSALIADYPVALRVISQANSGRFLARWAGVEAAKHERLLLLDARVLVDPEALVHVESHPQIGAWNGHVRTDPTTPLVGRFWEVPTHIFWGSYLRAPRPTVITPESFDRLPKGTGFLLVPRSAYRRAAERSWPDAGMAHLVSDDTKILRLLVAEHPLRLDPDFGATYRPRVTVRGFLRHAFVRGTLFVDSYAGTSAPRDLTLVLLAVLPVLAIVGAVLFAALGWGLALLVLLVAVVLGLLALPVAAALNRCPGRAILAYLVYVVPFGAVFWAGLARGVLVHRSAFGRRNQDSTVEAR